jgi:hypothetical protein
MTQVMDYLKDLVAQFQSNSIRATMDPRSVNPPCVLLTPPSLEININRGASAEFTALALVPGPGNADAFAALDRLTQDVCRNILVNAERITPVEYSPDDSPGYPAYQIEWSASLDWPDPCDPNTP